MEVAGSGEPRMHLKVRGDTFLEVKMTCLESQETQDTEGEVRERLATLDPEAPVSPLDTERGATK